MAVAIALGGGAPNLTLMTGALLALDEAEVDFKVITTTGAGMVAGLLYAAPRREHPDESWQQARRRALRATREMGIDDLIYDQFPVNYKIFQKPGRLAEAYAHAVNPAIWSMPRETRRQRLLSDTLAFAAAMMQPASLTPYNQGLCQPPPWIELIVDFSELQKNLADGDKKFRLTAYCIEDEDERTFHKEEITAEHFKAALAMPFIYSPYKMKDKDGTTKTYLEASAFRTMELNPEDVMNENQIDTVIYFDLMGNRNLIGEPRNLVDAWGKSIVAPLTQLARQQIDIDTMKRRGMANVNRALRETLELAEYTGRLRQLVTEIGEELEKQRKRPQASKDLRSFLDGLEKILGELKFTEEELERLEWNFSEDEIARKMKWLGIAEMSADEVDQTLSRRLLRMPFRDHIPDERWPKVLDWSHSNMSALFDIGYRTAEAFLDKHWDTLGVKRNGRPEPVDAEGDGYDIVWGERPA